MYCFHSNHVSMVTIITFTLHVLQLHLNGATSSHSLIKIASVHFKKGKNVAAGMTKISCKRKIKILKRKTREGLLGYELRFDEGFVGMLTIM